MEQTIRKTKEELVQGGLKTAMGYGDYRQMVAKLALEGKSTGPVQSEELVNYTRLNDQRMKRLDKTIKIDAVSEAKIKAIDKKITWLVLTESWCGDAAQTLPVMNKMAVLNRNISLRLLLRDENPALMEQFLTNGAMAIPKLISIADTTGKVIGEWGSRPSIAKGMVQDYKHTHGKLTAEFKQDLQLWYNKDKGQNTVSDLLSLLSLE
ncbi:thioredoxin family protein [Arenibacter sp. M-2]|uniref:thioredoxin family protein n=1 Tax=unclassified Arenibacter TaxID=2615047 RepID=UPI000D76677F|nr:MULTISPECIES: thioredoxin family protein [unclassified Arenibacter]MDL5510977.1 thioredoxin family protein [Arenibacter sp. M-2]PXX31601.1 thioredoxin-like protein [Arenibacter sp. ARW7G5Y1]|tara:strand:+ start:12552 stop:13175 length:624 start_codon:yes stop_codon:yes gene_type:complete